MLEDDSIALSAEEKPTTTQTEVSLPLAKLDSADGYDTASALYVEEGMLIRQFCL